MTRIVLAGVLAAVVAAVGCTAPVASPSIPAERLSVVATTTVFADLVSQVGGDRVTVHSLVPKGGEVHTFDPAPSDAARLTGARLIVMNGLGLDEWLLQFAQDAGAGSVPIVELAEDLEDVEYLEGGEEHEEEPAASGEEEEEHRFNPHLWMNPEYARQYVDRIRLKLIEIDPAGQSTYDSNATAYDTRLQDLHTWAAQQMQSIPADARRIVSFHDAFPYFAAAYDLEVVGVVVEAPGQDPSAAEVARLIDAIKQSGVRAILSETQFNDELVQTISAETGARVVSDLYTDTLGDPPVDTYEAAIRYDVDQIAAALR